MIISEICRSHQLYKKFTGRKEDVFSRVIFPYVPEELTPPVVYEFQYGLCNEFGDDKRAT